MNIVIQNKTYAAPPVCTKEILRYAGCKQPDDGIAALLAECMGEAEPMLSYHVCYATLPLTVQEDLCDFSAFRLASKHLARQLQNCQSVLLFGATVGVGIDRLIAKYGRLSPTKALLFQAIGTERIEALCDAFCADMAETLSMEQRPRFSPGYGDLPLTAQQQIFSVLDCAKRIGLTLTHSQQMSPSKSVTAFVGLSEQGVSTPNLSNKCSTCHMPDCRFRGAL